MKQLIKVGYSQIKAKRRYGQIILAVLLFLLCVRIVSSQQSNLEQKPSVPSSPITELEKQRLDALPTLRAQLTKENLRARADIIFVLTESFFNKILAQLTGQQFTAGGLFTVKIDNPQIKLRNGLALVNMEAQVGPTGSDIAASNRLLITARLLVEQNESSALIAKLQVIELRFATPTTTDTTSAPAALPALSPQQLSSLLPPLTLPLDLEFNQTIEPSTVKQNGPVAFEVSTEQRRIHGRFEVTELLVLDGRLAVLARVHNLKVK
ncbi:MAG: hypothetical protein AB1489_23680 [Acidobacteriota bacterium]